MKIIPRIVGPLLVLLRLLSPFAMVALYLRGWPGLLLACALVEWACAMVESFLTGQYRGWYYAEKAALDRMTHLRTRQLRRGFARSRGWL